MLGSIMYNAQSGKTQGSIEITAAQQHIQER